MSALTEMLSGAGRDLAGIGGQIIQLPGNILGAIQGPQTQNPGAFSNTNLTLEEAGLLNQAAKPPGIVNRTTTAARKTLGFLGELSDAVDEMYPHSRGQHNLSPFGLLNSVMKPAGEAGHAISDIFSPRAVAPTLPIPQQIYQQTQLL